MVFNFSGEPGKKSKSGCAFNSYHCFYPHYFLLYQETNALIPASFDNSTGVVFVNLAFPLFSGGNIGFVQNG
jgi:hypothetical protein